MDDADLKRQRLQARREYPETLRAFDAYRTLLMDNWAASPPNDTVAREGIYAQIKAMKRIEEYLDQARALGQEDIEEVAKQFAATEE